MLLNDDIRREVTELFDKSLENPVTIIYFTQDQPSLELPVQVEIKPCEYCEETENLLRELSELSEKISLEVYDLVKNKEEVERYQIDEVPALALVGDKDYGIRYYGIPSGYEFSTLLDGIVNVSKRNTHLSDSTKEALSSIDKPVKIKVFVTPT